MVLPWTHAHVCAGAACCFQLVCWHLQRSAPVLVPFCILLVVRNQKLQWVSTTIMKVIVVLVVMVIEVRGGDGRSDGDGVAILLGIALGMVMVWQVR